MKYVLAGLVISLVMLYVATRSDSGESVSGEAVDQRVSASSEKTVFVKPSKDRVREMVTAILQDIITGKASLDERGKLEDRAIAVMEIEELGTEDGRITTAVWLIDAISKQIEMAGLLSASISTDLTPIQVSATRELARQFAGDVKDRLANGAEGHEGAFMAAVDFTVPDGYVKVKWKTIGGFEYKEGMTLPEDALAFHQKKVGIAGYMMSLGQYADVRKFLLVESIWSCCFGIPPDVHQVVVVTIPDDKPSIELTSMPVMILGIFDVGEEKDGRWVTSVYRLTASEVKEID